MTYHEIAKILGCSHTTVERVEAQALAKLRDNNLLRQLFSELGISRRSNNEGTLTRDEAYGREKE